MQFVISRSLYSNLKADTGWKLRALSEIWEKYWVFCYSLHSSNSWVLKVILRVYQKDFESQKKICLIFSVNGASKSLDCPTKTTCTDCVNKRGCDWCVAKHSCTNNVTHVCQNDLLDLRNGVGANLKKKKFIVNFHQFHQSIIYIIHRNSAWICVQKSLQSKMITKF